MKKILLVLTLTLGTLVSKSQLREVREPQKLGEIKRAGYFVSSISYLDKGNYTLTYWDASYKTIDVYNSIKFFATDEELITIKDIFKKQCSAEKNSEKSFGLGENLITIKTIRAFGNSGIIVYISKNKTTGYFSLSEKEIEMLFGK